jgi:hypothetical protein
MGHVRLGNLPRSKAWNEVVGLIANGADVAQIADATLKAAEKAFQFLKNDKGFKEAIWLLTQLGIAGKTESPLDGLRGIGVDVSDNPSLPELTAAVSEALDNRLRQARAPSDFAEMAQRAIGGTLNDFFGSKLNQLWQPSADDMKAALSTMGRQKAFGEVGRDFFYRLTHNLMDALLSKTLSTQMGEGQRFATTNQKAAFDRAMKQHCKEASVIVERFAGEWFSKHKYEEGGNISKQSSDGFAAHSITKMTAELRMRADKHAE